MKDSIFEEMAEYFIPKHLENKPENNIISRLDKIIELIEGKKNEASNSLSDIRAEITLRGGGIFQLESGMYVVVKRHGTDEYCFRASNDCWYREDGKCIYGEDIVKEIILP